MVKYSLHINSPDASWTTLANAVERMGGHSQFVDIRLRGYPEQDQPLLLFDRSRIDVLSEPTIARLVEEPVHVSHILGKREHGMSTLENASLWPP